MTEGWLIYSKADYLKNTFFAEALMSYAKKEAINLILVFREELLLGIENSQLFVKGPHIKDLPQMVINRTRDSFLASHLEGMKIRVYNRSSVSRLCNHKAKTHQFASRLGLKSVGMLFCSKSLFNFDAVTFSYPVILKSASGHGGKEVFKCEDEQELCYALSKIEDDFLIQEMCDQPGVDVRVFVLGSHILGAVKRESKTDFRANYTLGGTVSLYQLTSKEEELVKVILSVLASDLVGIDFMISQDGTFLFNEIEDVVGTRTLYKCGGVDAAREYIRYIAKDRASWAK